MNQQQLCHLSIDNQTIPINQWQGYESINLPYHFLLSVLLPKQTKCPWSLQQATRFVTQQQCYHGIITASTEQYHQQGLLVKLQLQARLSLLQYETGIHDYSNLTPTEIIKTLLQNCGYQRFQLKIHTDINQQQVDAIQAINENTLEFFHRILTQCKCIYWFDSKQGYECIHISQHTASLPQANHDLHYNNDNCQKPYQCNKLNYHCNKQTSPYLIFHYNKLTLQHGQRCYIHCKEFHPSLDQDYTITHIHYKNQQAIITAYPLVNTPKCQTTLKHPHPMYEAQTTSLQNKQQGNKVYSIKYNFNSITIHHQAQQLSHSQGNQDNKSFGTHHDLPKQTRVISYYHPKTQQHTIIASLSKTHNKTNQYKFDSPTHNEICSEANKLTIRNKQNHLEINQKNMKYTNKTGNMHFNTKQNQKTQSKKHKINAIQSINLNSKQSCNISCENNLNIETYNSTTEANSIKLDMKSIKLSYKESIKIDAKQLTIKSNNIILKQGKLKAVSNNNINLSSQNITLNTTNTQHKIIITNSEITINSKNIITNNNQIKLNGKTHILH